jgi:hypothetical protein
MKEAYQKKQRDYAEALKAELRHKEQMKIQQRMDLENQMKHDV